MKVKQYLKLMRIKHYLKNGLIILPVLFGNGIMLGRNLEKLILGFLVFSFVASCIYILNDICDIEKDKMHEIKKSRPLASGEIAVTSAIYLLCFLAIMAIIISIYLIKSCGMVSIMIPIIYIMTNVSYSKGVKNIPIIDVGVLAFGFFLRVIYGSVIVNIEMSQWLYLTVIAFSFCLGFGKRRNELTKTKENNTRRVLEYYNYNFLDKNMYMCMSLGLVFYSLWTIDSTTVERFGNYYFSWTIPLVLIILLRYNLILEGDSHGDPIEVLLSDKVLLALTLVYIIAVFILIYIMG